MSAIRTFLVNPNYISLMGWKQIIDESTHFKLIASTDSIVTVKGIDSSNTLILADLSKNQSNQSLEEISKLIIQPNVDVLLVVDLDHHSLIQQLKNMGIRGILTTHCDAGEIKTALESIRLGKRFYCNDILDVLMSSGNKEKSNKNPNVLSVRETEVLAFIVKGLTTNQIADQLSVSTHTINSHRKNMLKKLGLTSPVELIVYAVKKGLVELEES